MIDIFENDVINYFKTSWRGKLNNGFQNNE